MPYPISLTQSKRHKQIPISITAQKAGCKATRKQNKKINLFLSILCYIYSKLFQLPVIQLRGGRDN